MSVNSFYFNEFSADYYVTRSEDGLSHMSVSETLKPVFPNYNQNLGLIRYIPYTNQGGKNLTVPDRQALNLSITRNGYTEPIYGIEREDGYYAVSTGDDVHYLHGEQTFVFKYQFERVITDFSDHQELYWDTNGTGWSQKFNALSASVHFEDSLLESLRANPSCYVGVHGEKGSPARCQITRTDDGYRFAAVGELRPGENLTFAIDFKPGTFATPLHLNPDFIAPYIVGGIFITLLTIFIIKFRRATRAKRRFYKNLFVTPQYQPMKNLSVAEAQAICTKFTHESRVASLMSLAVEHKITLIRSEQKKFGKYQWFVRIDSLSNITPEQRIMLSIINNGEPPEAGATIQMKTHRANSVMQALSIEYDTKVKESLQRKGYLEVKQKGAGLFAGIVRTLSKYGARTEEGLRAARYFEGLELYMKMAEAERIKFLQSVDKADTSPQGIVKIYEKLLPYAIIFGLEHSWMQELNRYYELENIDAPTWYAGMAIMSTHDLHHFVSTSSAQIRQSTTSSNSSGSGGGGFSGGGGGGGGGGGR